jgi:hypothetical protein
MPPLLHKFGINLRYLGASHHGGCICVACGMTGARSVSANGRRMRAGYLYCLFTQERLKHNCIGFQMIARTLKVQSRSVSSTRHVVGLTCVRVQNILRAKLRAKRGMAEESYR